MIEQVLGMAENQRIGLREFIHKYRQPPYGLGDIALSILFATLLRFFGDTIKIKKDEAAIGDLYIADFEMVSDIIKGNFIAKTVTWKGNSGLSSLAGKPLRLHLLLRDAKLYALQFPS